MFLSAVLEIAACAHHSPQRRPLPDLVTASLPGVVLLVRGNPDGTIGYGAGVLIDEHGTILTNLHVVANATTLGAMFYDPERRSYIPDDGGLARYLFENRADVSPAELVRADAVIDLAIVRADRDTSPFSRLPIRGDVPALGESVVAFGHPQETVWSFSTGVVSATHQGMLQTNAAINPGNSGGPLVDDQGRVVAINTSKLLGGSENIAFARPITMAERLLHPDAPRAVDRTAPDGAFVSCLTAIELASPASADCVDWSGVAAAVSTGVASAMEKSGYDKDAVARTVARMAATPALSPAGLRASMATNFASDDPDARQVVSVFGGVHLVSVGPAFTSATTIGPGTPQVSPRWLASNGLKLDPRNPSAFAETLKMGTRVEAQAPAGAAVWLDVRGRNTDGSEYRYSQCMILGNDGWTLSITASSADLDLLPSGWAPPLSTRDSVADAIARTAMVSVTPAAP